MYFYITWEGEQFNGETFEVDIPGMTILTNNTAVNVSIDAGNQDSDIKVTTTNMCGRRSVRAVCSNDNSFCSTSGIIRGCCDYTTSCSL